MSLWWVQWWHSCCDSKGRVTTIDEIHSTTLVTHLQSPHLLLLPLAPFALAVVAPCEHVAALEHSIDFDPHLRLVLPVPLRLSESQSNTETVERVCLRWCLYVRAHACVHVCACMCLIL